MSEAQRHDEAERDWANAVPSVCDPEESYGPAPKPRLLDQVRDAIPTLHYSHRTEEAYVGWIRRFIVFHGKRHPAEMGKVEIEQFLTVLAVKRHVGASTQNQVLSATTDPLRSERCVVSPRSEET